VIGVEDPSRSVVDTSVIPFVGSHLSFLLVNTLIHTVGCHPIEIVFVSSFGLFQSCASRLLFFSYFLSSFCLEHICATMLQAQWAEPPWGAEPIFELGPALH
jgi:hypothetical protein